MRRVVWAEYVSVDGVVDDPSWTTWFIPSSWGGGGHLVRDVVQTKTLKLVDTKTLTSGVVILSYEPSR